jgi:hypothetical protein
MCFSEGSVDYLQLQPTSMHCDRTLENTNNMPLMSMLLLQGYVWMATNNTCILKAQDTLTAGPLTNHW